MTLAARRAGIVLTTSFVFLGAALMFGVEPLIGRLLLRYFGSAAHVWLASMVLFQGLLLVGYTWAHLVAPRIGAWHLLFLALPIIVLPLDLIAEPSPDAPLFAIVVAVLRAVGLPFLAMSTVSVVAQWWWSRSELGRTTQPYSLYAASNAGSLIALLGYPLVVEPLLGLTAQRWLWSIGYLALLAVGAACWIALKPARSGPARQEPSADEGAPPSWSDRMWWLVLSALPSGFLLATTNVIAGEVGSFPLVWVVPLALYLGSFMIVFRNGGGVPRWISASWPELFGAALVTYMFGVANLFLVGLHALVLLLVAVLFHGELYERRPSASRLTSFYLWMSLGGFLGGMVVTFGAPYAFSGNWEYPILLLLILARTIVLRGTAVLESVKAAPLWLFGARLSVVLGALAVSGVGTWFFTQLAWNDLEQHRSFYGIFRVRDIENRTAGVTIRNILHGATLHGSQILDPQRRMEPTSYYHETQCIADAFAIVPSPRRIGIVGLGAGALAGYSRPGDSVDFFEIVPQNERIARKWFTWLDESAGKPRVFVGDGRLLLANTTETYDYLQMDAFSGDGIPVHLLNVEALRVYNDRLAPQGILVLHITNRYYDLRAVLKATAAVDGWSGVFDGPREVIDPLSSPAMCVVLARDPGTLQGLRDRGWRSFGPTDGLPDVRPWTDDYVNMFGALFRGRPQPVPNRSRTPTTDGETNP